MKDSQIYLKAAAEVIKAAPDIYYSCNAVNTAAGVPSGPKTRQALEYSDLFSSPTHGEASSIPPGEGYLWAHDVECLTNSIEWRALALCFMAAIAKSEGR